MCIVWLFVFRGLREDRDGINIVFVFKLFKSLVCIWGRIMMGVYMSLGRDRE